MGRDVHFSVSAQIFKIKTCKKDRIKARDMVKDPGSHNVGCLVSVPQIMLAVLLNFTGLSKLSRVLVERCGYC